MNDNNIDNEIELHKAEQTALHALSDALQSLKDVLSSANGTTPCKNVRVVGKPEKLTPESRERD
jgi:hypothetical protein